MNAQEALLSVIDALANHRVANLGESEQSISSYAAMDKALKAAHQSEVDKISKLTVEEMVKEIHQIIVEQTKPVVQ